MVEKRSSGIGAAIGNVIWVVLAGFWIAIAHILSGVALMPSASRSSTSNETDAAASAPR